MTAAETAMAATVQKSSKGGEFDSAAASFATFASMDRILAADSGPCLTCNDYQDCGPETFRASC